MYVMYKLISSVIIYVFVLKYVYCQEYVGLHPGDFCTFKTTGKIGSCQLINNCPAAIILLQTERIYPQTCGFQGKQPVICCENSNVVSASNEVSSSKSISKPMKSTTPLPLPPRNGEITSTTSRILSTEDWIQTESVLSPELNIGEKSRAKCREYEKYAYTNPVGGDHSSNNCALKNQVEIGNPGPTEFPHMALIGFEGDGGIRVWLCSGSLISDQFVLTAAHCLHHKSYGQAKYIRIGDVTIHSDDEGEKPQDFLIAQIFTHPDYKAPSAYNDIALLKLNRKPSLNINVRPACLETNDTLELSTKKFVASSWKLPESNILFKVNLKYSSYSECDKAHVSNIGSVLKYGVMIDKQLCASRSELGQSGDFCQADSGSPLQIVSQEHCMYNIVGVTSIGRICNAPAVFTKVVNYIPWIEEIVWP